MEKINTDYKWRPPKRGTACVNLKMRLSQNILNPCTPNFAFTLSGSSLRQHNLPQNTYYHIPFTTSRAVLWACPKMLVAKHWYTPASFPDTFFKCKRFSLCSVTSLPLCSLLHTIIGVGFPFAEHWKKAEPVSFTVVVTGETATSGTAIDSAGSPLVPGMPAGPTSPRSPLSPVSPFNPTSPMIPCLPLLPGDPIIPLSPLSPGLPFFPRGPGGPGGPGRPQGFGRSFEWHNCRLPSDRSSLILSNASAVRFPSAVFLIASACLLFLIDNSMRKENNNHSSPERLKWWKNSI